LYAGNTTKAITKKLIILEIRSPYLNSLVVPAKFGTFTVSAARLPAGKKQTYERIDYILNKDE
jgi:hypothetical protein